MPAVLEADVELLRVGDDVVIGEDVAVGADDEIRCLRCGFRRGAPGCTSFRGPRAVRLFLIAE